MVTSIYSTNTNILVYYLISSNLLKQVQITFDVALQLYFNQYVLFFVLNFKETANTANQNSKYFPS